MEQGTICIVIRDIIIDGVLVFQKGQQLVVESIQPNPDRPDCKYVIASPFSGVRYQLSDADVAPAQVPEASAQQPVGTRPHRLRWIAVSAVVLVVLVLAAGAVYFIFLRNKAVPDVMGLATKVAEQKITSAGFKAACTCKYPHPTGSEKVVSQDPKAGTKDKKINTVNIVITDPQMESAYFQASQAIGQANDSLREVQAMGIDTADLVAPIQNAQAKLNNARSVADCIGAPESAGTWAGAVINACNAKKQAFVAQQERSRQISNCKSTMISYARANAAPGISMSFMSFSMNGGCTAASAWLDGSVGGQPVGQVKIVAVRRGDSWVVTDFGTGI
jgi:hypothetical protein